jgi:Spy/CpxP family protein refolding chaperone
MALIMVTTLILSNNISAQGNMQKKEQFQKQIHQQLNFTDEQQTKIDDMKLTHQKDMIDLKANLEKKELELRELKNKGVYTRDEYLNKVNDIISARNKIALSVANHHMDIYQILDENQKKEWNKMSHQFGEQREKRVHRMLRNLDAE